jgi:hypothetical protein
MRQLGEMWPDNVIEAVRAMRGGSLAALLGVLLAKLAGLLGCEVGDLRLDHDPALATRMRRTRAGKTLYSPDANDPAHLIYRTAHAHHIKTNVRGEGAQHPDRVLIKRARRGKAVPKKVKKQLSHKRRFSFSTDKSVPKRKWPSRPFPKGRKLG